MSVFFTEQDVRGYNDVKATESWRYAPFFHTLLEHGVFAPPSPFEAWFVNAAMDDAAFDTIQTALSHAARAAAQAQEPGREQQ